MLAKREALSRAAIVGSAVVLIFGSSLAAALVRWNGLFPSALSGQRATLLQTMVLAGSGVILGGQLGPMVARRLRVRALRWYVAVLLLLLGLLLLVPFVTLAIFSRQRPLPPKAVEIDTSVGIEQDPLRFQESVLDARVMLIAARADASGRIDHALPGDVRVSGQGMECIANGSGRTGMPKPASNLAIRGDLPRRDLRHQVIDRGVKICFSRPMSP